jgi:DivIVA domain-containing protein
VKRLTPMEIFNKDFKQSLRGYDIEEVNKFLDQVIASYEDVLQENEYLKEEIKKLKSGGKKVSQATGRNAAVKNDDVINDILARLDRLEKIVLR